MKRPNLGGGGGTGALCTGVCKRVRCGAPGGRLLPLEPVVLAKVPVCVLGSVHDPAVLPSCMVVGGTGGALPCVAANSVVSRLSEGTCVTLCGGGSLADGQAVLVPATLPPAAEPDAAVGGVLS